MNEPFALEWTHVINRTDKSGNLRRAQGHQFCTDRDDAMAQLEKVKANASVIEITVYERINGTLIEIEKWPHR